MFGLCKLISFSCYSSCMLLCFPLKAWHDSCYRSHTHIMLGCEPRLFYAVFVAVVSHWENVSTWLSVMFIFISLKTPRTQSSFGYLWLNNFPFSFPGGKKSVYLLLVGGRMIRAQATGWLGQLSTAALCCWDGWERVTSHSVVPRRTSFSLLLELAHSHSLLGETLQS